MGNNIAVSVTADVADLTAKRAVMSAELKAAQRDLREFAETARTSGMTDELRASMLAAGGEVAKAGAQVKALSAEMKAATVETKSLGATMREMRDQATEVSESFKGIGEALIAAFAVERIAELTKHMAETAEETQHVATTFGLTTNQVQQLRAEAAGLGVPFEAFTNAMQREDRALTQAREGTKQAGEAFKVLGINIHEPIDNASLLQKTIEALASVQDVPTRIGLAMQLFGKNIQSIAPLIGATKEQIDGINATIAHSGVVNASAQAAGLALAEAFNRQKIEMMGLGQTVAQELAPSLTKIVDSITGLLESFRQWASQGSNLKNAVTGLAIAATALATVLGAGALSAAVEGLSALIAGMIAPIAEFAAGMLLAVGPTEALTAAQIGLDAAMDANPIGAVVLVLEALGAAAYFAYQQLDKTGALTAIGNDLSQAWTAVSDTFRLVADAVAPIAALIGDVTKAYDDFNQAQNAAIASAAETWWQGEIDKYKEANQQLGAMGDLMSLLDGIFPSVKKGGDDLNATMEGWSKNIHDVIAANFPDVARAWDDWVNTLSKDVASAAAAWQGFWDAVTGKGQSDDALKRLAADQGGRARAISDTGMATANQVPQSGGGPPLLNGGGGKKGGAEDPMQGYRTALAQLEDQSRASTGQWLADLSDMDLEYWNGILAHAKLSVKDREQIERTVADLTRKINGEAQQEVIAQDRAKIDADRGNVEALKADWQKYVDDTVAAYGSGARQVIEASRQMGDAIRAATQKNADDLARIIQHEVDQEVEAHKQGLEKEKQAYQQFKSVIGPVVSSFTSGLVQMAEGAQTFAQTMRNLGQQILNTFVSRVIDPMIEKWLWGQAKQLISTNVTNAAVTASNQASADANLLIAMETNLKKIAMDAKTAAAGAYNWAAAWGGPIAGAIAAAVAFAGVMAFGSFSKGVDVVPNDMIAQVHAGERIMPAADNSALMGALRSLGSLSTPRLTAPQMPSFGTTSGAGPWGGVSIGDTHIHTSSGAPDIRTALREHRSELLKQIGEGVRGGWTSPHANPFKGG